MKLANLAVQCQNMAAGNWNRVDRLCGLESQSGRDTLKSALTTHSPSAQEVALYRSWAGSEFQERAITVSLEKDAGS